MLVEAGGYHAAPASAAGYAAGSVANYLLNRRWTFRSDRPHPQGLARFTCMVALGCLFNVALMHVLAADLGINYLSAQVFVTAAILLFNFSLSASWVFGRQP
jgi:putative flippase GtrA